MKVRSAIKSRNLYWHIKDMCRDYEKEFNQGAAFLLNCLYSILKLLPVQKKITYISRQSNTLSVDFSMVIHEMEKRQPEYRNITLIKMIGDSIPEKIGYCFHMIRQMYHVATSEMVVLDTYCIVVSLLNQRKNLKVIQMWHALGAMKKFGYSILDKGKEQRNPWQRLCECTGTILMFFPAVNSAAVFLQRHLMFLWIKWW